MFTCHCTINEVPSRILISNLEFGINNSFKPLNMWQGARGNRVSPDPWGMEIEEIPMNPPPESEWSEFPPEYSETKEVKPIVTEAPKVMSEKRIIVMKKPETEFVYHKRDKGPLPVGSHLEGNKMHKWRPFLWERKRY